MDGGITAIPKLSISSSAKPPKAYDPNKQYAFRYEDPRHKDLPHVVKFSGGRSSAMLLFALLENGLLNAARGDVVVFNNTSAEHPATYRFTARCKKLVEEQYGIPFFWVEFQTYEDARGGEWTRLPSYRLVEGKPSTDPLDTGFHWRGEVFEEMLSWAGYVPNQFRRICTNNLKLQATRLFLRDWFACKEMTDRLGHHGKSSRLEDDAIHSKHKANGGGVPREIFLGKKAYVRSRPPFRPAQRFADFSSAVAQITNPALATSSYGDTAVFGTGGVEYTAFVGLRYDEMRRVTRVRGRNAGGPESDGYEGEHVYMPLADMAVTRKDVNSFWAQQTWDLELEENTKLSNCVFCFLKGLGNLEEVQRVLGVKSTGTFEEYGSLQDTPSDIRWWVRMEKLYGRDLDAEKRSIKEGLENTFVGFFGTGSGFSYDLLSRSPDDSAALAGFADTVLPCDCTD